MTKRKVALIILAFLFGCLTGITIFYLKTTPRHSIPIYRDIAEPVKSFAEIVKTVSPSVVNISTTRTVQNPPTLEDLFEFLPPYGNSQGKKWKETSMGSGVIVSPDGYILTNYHVIEQAEEIKVTLYDRRAFRASLVGADPKTDLAVIKIDAKDLPVASWGNSDNLQVGDFVLAIGNPYGLTHTVTMGIISATGRADVGIADYEDFIQTDAAINPGNSGGPLVNIKGEIIGINTAIFSRTGGYQGIGFAVPSNMARIIKDSLIKEGKVIRGWIGIMVQDLTAELAERFDLKESYGVIITDVTKQSPAYKAGLRRGDIILEYDGKKITESAILRNLVAQSKIGSIMNLKFFREGQIYTTSLTIAQLPSEPVQELKILKKSTGKAENPLKGLSVVDLDPSMAKQIGADPDDRGVVVYKIEPGSPAENTGLKKGDLIMEIERQRIMSVSDFQKAVQKISRPDILVLINRGGKKFYVILGS
ncbi:serine protease Do [Thermodesulfovibrio aggregans]|uniref:Serine protease Do n=1 Tax=Thermodesulfovibrio aggregans TaxID=86166 RepID=A0A0U9HQ88_9BACT|nr:DegQ family serine endoprotease [Thermodesulfovibrio aggregans]GAQ95196.1 serine protease Do [Thermodesulfovibrio aggregans]